MVFAHHQHRLHLSRLLAVSLVMLMIGCTAAEYTPPAEPATPANSGAVLTPTAFVTQPAMLVLSKAPIERPIPVRVGQQVQLPARFPVAKWQLDYDPDFWQLAAETELPIRVLIAKRNGETELVQRERPATDGTPAMRQFRYVIIISP